MTKVLVVTDFKMICKEDKIYLKDTTYNTMKRYKDAFGYVTLCTRDYPDDSIYDFVLANDVVDEAVKVTNLINTLLGKHDDIIKKAIIESDLVIVRLPSIISYRAAEIAKSVGKPLFSIAIGCAWDAYWNHRFPGKIIAPYMFFKMRWCLKKSDYTLYVTEEFLQNRYPTSCKSIGVSDVVINNSDDNVLTERIKRINSMSLNEVTLMTSGSVGNKAKGQEYVIKAIPLLNKKGIKVNYLLAGGESPDYLKSLANKLGVSNQVVFLGMLSTDDVFKNLDRTDIYIQPSLQEGLPRAVVEAMSRGCPAIGAKTGGIPELLEADQIFARKSSQEIADKIIQILNKQKMIELSNYSFYKAKEYLDNVLSAKRNFFYDAIKTDIQREE